MASGTAAGKAPPVPEERQRPAQPSINGNATRTAAYNAVLPLSVPTSCRCSPDNVTVCTVTATQRCLNVVSTEESKNKPPAGDANIIITHVVNRSPRTAQNGLLYTYHNAARRRRGRRRKAQACAVRRRMPATARPPQARGSAVRAMVRDSR